MLTFALAVLLLIATPGPGVLSTAGVGSAFGWRPGLSYVSGLWVGTNLVSLAIITGLAAIIFSVPVVRTILLFASSAYLGYLALRIALAGSKISFITATKPPGFLSGLFLQFINPKAYAVNTALFTSFAFYPQNIAFELTAKAYHYEYDLVAFASALVMGRGKVAYIESGPENTKNRQYNHGPFTNRGGGFIPIFCSCSEQLGLREVKYHVG